MTLTTPSSVETEPAHEPVERPRSPAGRAVGIVLGALLVASLLNADALANVADQQPLGWRRDVAVGLVKPIHAVADATGLTAPRRWLDELTGRDDQTVSDAFGGDVAPPTPVLDRAPAPITTIGSKEPATPSTTAPPEHRVPTAAKPLRVLFAGDSLIGTLADGYARYTDDSGTVRVTSEVHVGTGLARPDVLDWGSYLATLTKRHKPEVIYLMFGGNDDQPLRGGEGDPPALLSSEWKREYRRRVAFVMDLAAGDDRSVVWIGLPVVTRDRLNRARLVMNTIAFQEARKRKLVQYVGTDAVLAPHGRFERRIPVFGGLIDVRSPDGVHVTPSGADLLAPRLFAKIADEWNLERP